MRCTKLATCRAIRDECVAILIVNASEPYDALKLVVKLSVSSLVGRGHQIHLQHLIPDVARRSFYQHIQLPMATAHTHSHA